MRADEFYPIFGHFWPLWLILCTLVHFGENTVMLVGTHKWAVAVTMTPGGLGYTYLGLHFDS